jgi:protein ImuB
VLPVEGRLTVAAVDATASATGLAPGLPLADARALVPPLAVVAADPAGDAKALAGLADWCGRYTPWVAVDGVWQGGGAAGLMLDVSGAAHLFGGEAGLVADLVARLRRLGFAVAAAVADSPGAAWAAARFLTGQRGWTIVAPGEARPRLAPLPVAALRLGAETAAGLARLGVGRLGDLYDLPRAPLTARFGSEVARRLEQALGLIDEPIAPRLPAPGFVERLAFAEPIGRPDDIAGALHRLLGRLCAALEAGGRGARRLELILYRVDGTLQRAAVGTSRAGREPAHLQRLFAEHLGRLDPGFGVEAMTLAARRTEPFGAVQLDLLPELVPPPLTPTLSPQRGEREKFAERESAMSLPLPPAGGEGQDEGGVPPPTGRRRAAPEDLHALVDRLANRLGPENLLRLAPCESHVPERAVHAVPATASPARASWDGLAPRPLRLLARPEAIEATAPVPDHPPVMFRWRRVLHRVRAADGPERIAPEWWREAGDAAMLTRDYFRVEDKDGARFWLYREGPYGADPPPRWYLHGVFA